jgi:hypothetical protein
MSFQIIEKRQRAKYLGLDVTIIGRRCPTRYETGAQLDIKIDGGCVMRDIPESQVTFEEESEVTPPVQLVVNKGA